jgi:hypothetical protein
MMAMMLSIKRRVLQGARLPAGLLWQWIWSPCLFAFCLLPDCVVGHIRFVDVFSESGKPLVSWKHGKTARSPRSTLKEKGLQHKKSDAHIRKHNVGFIGLLKQISHPQRDMEARR